MIERTTRAFLPGAYDAVRWGRPLHRITYTPSVSGTYWLDVGSDDGGTGTYTVSATTDFDDFPGDTTSTGELDFFGTVFASGDLEASGDTDWFRVELLAGTQYTFDAEGEFGAGSLENPLLTLFDDGSFTEQDDDGGTGTNASLTFTPATLGIYWLEVRSFGTDPAGTYTVSAAEAGSTTPPDDGGGDDGGDGGGPDPTPTDDFAGDLSSSGSVTVGGSMSGELELSLDRDWFSVQLTAGQDYTFDVSGAESGGGTLADPFLVLRDGDGTFIEQDDDGGTGVDASVTFTPATSGTYWLEVRSFGTDPAGTYTVSAAETGSTTPPDDGGRDDGGDGGGDVPNPSLTDDFSGDLSSSGSVALGGSMSGELELSLDRDWFGVQLTAGQDYTFDVSGSDSGGGTLADPFLVLRDDGGTFIEQNDDGGTGVDASITFTPTTSGTYWLEVRSFGTDPVGTYTVSAAEAGSTTPPDGGGASDDDEIAPVVEGETDFAANTSSTGTFSDGGSVDGSLSASGDIDWVSIELTAGQVYAFDLVGEGSGNNTLADPFLVLRDANGTFVDQDDDGGSGLNASILFTPDTSGTYWLDARSATAGETGTYTLRATVMDEVTDFAASTSSDATVILGGDTTGTISSSTDRDWVSVQLTAGDSYTFDLEGEDTGRGTLFDPFLILRDSNGLSSAKTTTAVFCSILRLHSHRRHPEPTGLMRVQPTTARAPTRSLRR